MNILKQLFGKKEESNALPAHIQSFKIFGTLYRREDKSSKLLMEDALIKFSDGAEKNSYLLEVSKDSENFYFPISAKMDLREQSTVDGDKTIRKYVFDLEAKLRIRVEFDVTLPKDLEEVLKFEEYFSELIVINQLERALKPEDKGRVDQACRHIIGKDTQKEVGSSSQKDSDVFSIVQQQQGNLKEDSSSTSSVTKLVREMEGLNIHPSEHKKGEFHHQIKLFQKRPNYLAALEEEEEKEREQFNEDRIIFNQNNEKLQDAMLQIVQMKEIKLAQVGCMYETQGDKMVLKHSGIVFAIKQLEDFDFKLLIYSQDQLVVHQYHFQDGNGYEISSKQNYLRWIENKGHSQNLYQVTFDNPNVSKDIALIIQKCHYEAANKVEYTKAFKEEEIQDQIRIATTMKDQDDYSYNSGYLNDTIQDITFNPKSFMAQGEAKSDSNLRTISQAKTLDRTFVTKGENIEVYRTLQEESLDLQYLLSFPIVKGLDGSIFEPKKMLLQEQDTKMLLLNNEENKKVFYFDIEKGKVIQEFSADQYGYNSIRDICNQQKNGELDNNKSFYSINSKNIFLMDPRLSKGEALSCVSAETKEYTTNNNFSCISSTVNGEFAIGSQDGTVRLFNKVSTRAKNSFNMGYGDPIRGLDISKDGKWILATCQSYLVLYPTYDNTNQEKSGFTSVVKVTDRPNPIRLQLTCEDQMKQKLTDLSFSPAKFDNNLKTKEQFIVTSTHDLTIVWNFAKVLKGKRSAYEIRKSDDQIQYADFKFNQHNNVLAASNSKVELQNLINNI